MGSYEEIYDYLETLLDVGVNESNENLDICCPDCVNSNDEGTTYKVYVLASVETYLKFAEVAGCTQSAAVPAIGYGAVESNSNPYCKCCLQVIGSVETVLKLQEATGGGNYVNSCPNNFTSCKDLLIDSLLEFEGIEAVDRILDKGIVEYNSLSGSSQICKINDFINQIFELEPFATLSRIILLDRILDKGIVISCYNDEIQFASVESWINWAQYSGIFPVPVVPA